MAEDSSNPFGDPVATLKKDDQGGSRTADAVRVDTAALGDYNPFDASSNLSGQITANPQFPPAYSALDAQLSATAELERRQRELDARAAELARREEEQKRLAEQARRSSQSAKNWPPLPSFCPMGPCFYLDIRGEIHEDYQRMVYYGYYLWMAYAALLCVNFLGAVVYFAGTSRTDSPSQFGLSIIILAFCVPASFICWFRPLYKAFRSNSSINFFIFFIVFGAQIAVMGIQALGLPGTGSCGWITALGAVKDNPGVGGFIVLIAVLFTALAAMCALYLIRVHRIYRNTGASFGKAREEFARGVVSDPAVRAAAFGSNVFASNQ